MKKDNEKVYHSWKEIIRQRKAIVKEQAILDASLMAGFKELVEEFGEDNRLYTLDACSEWGAQLADNPIDRVEISGGDVYFVFSENSNKYMWFMGFATEDLYNFYLDLVDYFQNKEDEEE